MANSGAPKCPYSPSQMEVLSALCDTLLPSIDVPRGDKRHESVVEFFRTSASMAGTPLPVANLLGEKVIHPKIYLSGIGLTLLSTRIGTCILCGRHSLSTKFPYFLKFAEISPEKREQILVSWSRSFFFLLRVLYTAIKIFTLLVFFTQVNEKNENITWKAIGYCGPDPNLKTQNPKAKTIQEEDVSEEKEKLFGPLYKGIIHLNQSRTSNLDKLRNLGFPVSTNHSRNRRMKSLKPSFVIKCDVAVVGSGSGGGVVAGVLAKAGYKVLVLERGRYLARSNLSLLEGEALDQMYLGNGISGTEHMDVILLAGSTVGGGSTINWSASIKTPPHVIKEWSEDHGLELFDSKDFAKALDVVCRKMGVQSEFKQEGFNGMVLRKGCENLGYPIENIPNNAPPDHYCGWCSLGCKDGKKRCTSETWLVDLVESGNGAILPECEAVQVITDKRKGRKRAIGVAFTFLNQGVKETAILESDVTVVSCGAILTPPLLKRSGLKNPNIGKNLHLHPVVLAWGYFPESDSPDSWPEGEKKSYNGSILTNMSTVVANFEDSGYGTVIQTPALHPGMFSVLMPWLSGTDIKQRMLKFSRTAHLFALARDKSSGAVVSPTRISYKWEKSDTENLSKGVERALRILAASGAEEIGTHNNKGRVLKVKQADSKELDAFVREESLRPLKNLETPICSAHQMGSCRMGVDPKESAVRPNGETWEVEGLFVADSSVFPTALGVNPMVTVQAIAYCTAQSVLEVLGKGRVQLASKP
ncbi:long-chain-alcohol oxidase FAO4A [Henckelia pumila]|uniref:long-chain-alcohol oxidase FAO4A n=1 Tax=Henckelia pumila TaxID=405737 RepID=UPI003C6E1612